MGGRGARGFTLIEVLVALTVVAVVLGSLIHVGGEQARQQTQARQGQLAQWVAANALAEYRLQQPELAPQRIDRIESMAGQSWRVELRVEAAGAPGLWQVSVTVSPRGSTAQAAYLVTFMGQA